MEPDEYSAVPNGLSAPGSQPKWLLAMWEQAHQLASELDYPPRDPDQDFIAFLRMFGRFGFFTFGPITIDIGMVEDLFMRTAARGDGVNRYIRSSEVYVPYSVRIWEEFRKSGRPSVEPLHVLLALMRSTEGLAARVFGELGVTTTQVEEYASSLSAGRAVDSPRSPAAERLYSTEEAAAYFNVHIQTVRVWIRSGKLPAFRLAGQKAIRIRESDLKAVLEPISPSELSEV